MFIKQHLKKKKRFRSLSSGESSCWQGISVSLPCICSLILGSSLMILFTVFFFYWSRVNSTQEKDQLGPQAGKEMGHLLGTCQVIVKDDFSQQIWAHPAERLNLCDEGSAFWMTLNKPLPFSLPVSVAVWEVWEIAFTPVSPWFQDGNFCPKGWGCAFSICL